MRACERERERARAGERFRDLSVRHGWQVFRGPILIISSSELFARESATCLRKQPKNSFFPLICLRRSVSGWECPKASRRDVKGECPFPEANYIGHTEYPTILRTITMYYDAIVSVIEFW